MTVLLALLQTVGETHVVDGKVERSVIVLYCVSSPGGFVIIMVATQFVKPEFSKCTFLIEMAPFRSTRRRRHCCGRHS